MKTPANAGVFILFSRGTRIRTWDPLVPNQVRYRTALHPDDFCLFVRIWLPSKVLQKYLKF